MKRSVIFVLLAACGSNKAPDTTGQQSSPLTVRAECAPVTQTVPQDAWTCGETRTAECDNTPDAAPISLLFAAQGDGACATKYKAVPAVASAPGTYAVDARDDDTDALVCSATLVVVDTKAPELSAKASELWPPNHKLHRFTPSDCVDVNDVCDATVRLTFAYVISNEAQNGTGDGNTDADVVNLGCDSVELRAERAGTGASRVYRLGVLAEDQSGNKTSAECLVTVPHDRGNKAKTPTTEVAYRIDVPSCE